MGDGDFNLCSPYKKEEQITQEYGINMCNFFLKTFFILTMFPPQCIYNIFI